MMAMGMQEAFTPSADFSGMADEDLFISLLQQFTYVKVNEEGTEAAAVTVGGMDVAAPRTKYGNSVLCGPSFHLSDKGEEYGSYSVYG